MNPVVLGISGVILTLSSFISAIFLIKRNFRRCKASPLNILVTSDILNSVLMAVLLFLNQFRVMTESNEAKGAHDIMEILQRMNGTTEEIEDTDCNFETILMNYALFLIPFANSFVSLLSMSLQCNLDAELVRTKCQNFVHSRGVRGSKKSIFDGQKKNAITAFSVTGQWLVPILLTLILHFADRESTSDLQRAADVSCVFTTSFPFENCYLIADGGNEVLNASQHFPLDKKNYMHNLTLDRTHVSITDDIVSKVYGIVQSTLNSSGQPFRKPETHYDQSQLLNITNFTRPMEKEENELRLFEGLMKNLSSEYITEDSRENLAPTTTEVPRTVPMRNVIKDNVHIYNDIVHKIQSTKLNVRDRIRRPVSQRARLYSDDGILTLEEQILGSRRPPPRCTRSQCFISTNFLKVHLFFLLIFVYLTPIVASTLLIVRQRYVCSSVLEKLEISATPKTLPASEAPQESPPKPSKFGWFGKNQEDTESENCTDDCDVEDSERGPLDGIRQETREMEKMSEVFRTSLLAAVVLWTPMFLEILMTVFLCLKPPAWLMNFFYLLAVSFGAARNYLNLRMLRSSEILSDSVKRRNIVHPTSVASTSDS